ncbi:MAG: YeeE/YedE family protein [Salinivirgaceae bacterium]|nr:YeeE/YedE family protein [Salinivirgaceae bacterium]
MGPLIVNEIISSSVNFLMAFLIGIGFGFVLESSGFSSSRKLAGVFYGYDTVVLKVFFTAAITAAIGLLFFSLFGWIDLSLVYVNPTFLPSAIAGGVIMGAGFIMGGFCPGTSVCAAVIGKIDAMVFIGGIILGIIVFAEGYPLWESFYKSGFMGTPRMSDWLGWSQGVFAFVMVLAAFAMFFIGEWAEKKFPQKEY